MPNPPRENLDVGRAVGALIDGPRARLPAKRSTQRIFQKFWSGDCPEGPMDSIAEAILEAMELDCHRGPGLRVPGFEKTVDRSRPGG